MTDQNAMCKCGRERIAKGCSVEIKLPTYSTSWGICNLCGHELANGSYPTMRMLMKSGMPVGIRKPEKQARKKK